MLKSKPNLEAYRDLNSYTIFLYCLAVCSCASVNELSRGAPPEAEAPLRVFNLLRLYEKPSQNPLTGSFPAGADVFKSAEGAGEAELVFKKYGPYLVLFCGLSCGPELNGVMTPDQVKKIMADATYRHIFIPGSSDVWTKDNRPYYEAALGYLRKFNVRMVELLQNSRQIKKGEGS